MDNADLKASCPQWLTIPPQHVDRLLESGSGDCSLLYLYLLRNGGKLNLEEAAEAMHLSVRAIRSLAVRLEGMGLLVKDSQPPLPDQDAFQPRVEEIVHRSQTDPAFQALVTETQTILGRYLGRSDLEKLFLIYNDLGMPADVIMLLIHHCQEEINARYHDERTLGFAYIMKTAYDWFEREILTYPKAEAWLAELERRKSLTEEIKRLLGIRDRDLSPSERKYIESWIEMGYTAETLAIAADRMFTGTGRLNWKYMDSIVRSWNKQGLFTKEDIQKRDRKTDTGHRQQQVTHPADAAEMERMRKLREKLANS